MANITSLIEGVSTVFKHFKPQPLTAEIDGENYRVTPGPNGLAVGDHIRKPGPTPKPTLMLQTLTGFVDAYTAKIDDFPETVAVHVSDHLTVSLRSMAADEFGRRHEWVRSVCGETNPFKFNQYQVPEQFLIDLQSGFLPTDDVINLQKFASVLSNDMSIATQDDGFSQTVTVNAGGVKRSDIPLPRRLKLYTYRTFREIDPVESEYIVRLQGKQGELPKIALLEVDAGRWKLDTITLIAQWLRAKLPTAVVIA